MLLTTFLVSLPIGVYFFLNPADLLKRAGQVGIWSTSNPLYNFIKSSILHLAMFNIRGDPNFDHNFACTPELFWPVGILFLIGIFISFRKIISNQHKMSYLTLILWFFFLLLPGALTFEGIPHSQRVIGVIPAVMILSAIGGIATYNWLKSWLPERVVKVIVFLFALVITFQAYYLYFIIWFKN